jgi:hypothetical protein
VEEVGIDRRIIWVFIKLAKQGESKVKLSVYQTVEAHEVVRRRESHIF